LRRQQGKKIMGNDKKVDGAEPRARQAIEGTRLNAFGVDPQRLTVVGLDTKDGKEHPLYDERVHLPVDEALVKNIMVFGVLEPALVRKNGTLIEVIDGRRRTVAAREANRRLRVQGSEEHTMPCMVKRGDSAQIMGVMLSTFIRMNDSPLLEAVKIQRYLDTGRSEADAAVVYGCNVGTIKLRLALLDLSPSVQSAIKSGRLSPQAGLELSDLTHQDQEKRLRELEGANGDMAGKIAKAPELRRERVARAQGEKVVTSKVVNRAMLREISTNADFQEAAGEEAQALLAWILGTGDGGSLKKLLRKIAKSTAS